MFYTCILYDSRTTIYLSQSVVDIISSIYRLYIENLIKKLTEHLTENLTENFDYILLYPSVLVAQYPSILYTVPPEAAGGTIQYENSTIQYYIVLYSTIQYYIVLYSTIQYCIVLYSTIQYYIVLFSYYIVPPAASGGTVQRILGYQATRTLGYSKIQSKFSVKFSVKCSVNFLIKFSIYRRYIDDIISTTDYDRYMVVRESYKIHV